VTQTVDREPSSPCDDLAARYVDGDYLAHNPTWDVEHSQRKAREILSVIDDEQLAGIFHRTENHVVDVGCGAGGVLYYLVEALGERGIQTVPAGYDVSPAAIEMARQQFGQAVTYTCAAEPPIAGGTALVLLVDVLEHVADPGALVRSLASKSDYMALRIPLDRSLWNLATRRFATLRRTLGHVHYYTYRSALALLERNGLRVIKYALSENFRQRSVRQTRVARMMYPVRRVTSWMSPKLNSLLWGGNSLVVLAAGEGV